MNAKYVWERIFPFANLSATARPNESAHNKMNNLCSWICRAHTEKHLSRNQTSNLMTRIRHDYNEDWEWWFFISDSDNYKDFCRNIPQYMSCRAKYPSRDKLPVDPKCLPWSNEKLYGRGINSNVRMMDR